MKRVEFSSIKRLPVKHSLRVKVSVKTYTDLQIHGGKKKSQIVSKKFSCCFDKNASLWCIGDEE
jgi:hypothetical protein